MRYGRHFFDKFLDLAEGNWKLIYSPNTPPENLFDDIVCVALPPGQKSENPEGYIYLQDRRPGEAAKTGYIEQNDGTISWHSKYGKPSALLKEILKAGGIYIATLGSVEIIRWPDGRILTICRDDNHIYDIWAGLELPEDQMIEEEDTP